ncbi:MAG: GFA family protein [Proteobacteria bacterium]|nr:GFA family protein [Pseudomonadota bacterium]
MVDQIAGGCLCGAVRYESGSPVSGPAYCHCASCRRSSGANAVAWMTVDRHGFRYTRGTPREYASSAPVRRTFCGDCGSTLTYWNRESPNTIDITIATLDEPSEIRPVDHIWMSDAIAWDRPADGLPQHARWRKNPSI